MGNKQRIVIPAPAPETTDDKFPVSLDDACTMLSATYRKSVELLGGFHAHERASGITHDTMAAYRSRFDQFRKRPAR